MRFVPDEPKAGRNFRGPCALYVAIAFWYGPLLMPAPLRKTYPALDLEKAQEQVRKALRRAFKECGNQSAFVRKLNVELQRRGEKPVTQQTVSWWVSEGTFVDRRFWRSIETVTDYATTRRQLRPDQYRDDEVLA
jgi:hypothetical protein